MINKIQEYLDSPDVKGLSEATQDNYKRALDHYKNWLENGGKEFSGFVDRLKRKGVGETSIQQYITRIKIFYKWLGEPLEYTYKISNHARKLNKRKHLQRWFQEDDITKCLGYEFQKTPKLIDRLRNQILVRLLLETGARVRELSFVQAKDVDLDDGIIWLYDSKTEPRPSFFGPETKEMFENYKGQHLIWGGPLFPEVEAIKYVITDMLQELGLKNGKDGRGPHTFRHYCASYLFYCGGMRIEDIAFLLGDKVETIVNRYLHPTPLMLRERVAKAMKWEE